MKKLKPYYGNAGAIAMICSAVIVVGIAAIILLVWLCSMVQPYIVKMIDKI